MSLFLNLFAFKRQIKYLNIGWHEFWALTIILGATGLRMLLTASGWPQVNSDEGTMGIMARHIAYGGEHPIYFYGQQYMGTIEAYLAAALFHLFGPSTFTLRLSVILLTALFLVVMYLLTSLLYTKKLALFTLAILSLGSSTVLSRELFATGGSTQTLLFGALAFLLSARLSFSYQRGASTSKNWRRLAEYGSWGLVIGLGLWSDLVVLPFFAMAALLLLLFCWRDLRSWAPLSLLTGFVIGFMPVILYNIYAIHGEDSISVFLGLFHSSSQHAPSLIKGLIGTVQISLPMATGDPFCPVQEVPFFGDTSVQTLQCQVIHTTWSIGYLVLWAIAFLMAILILRKLRLQSKSESLQEVKQYELVLHNARLMLIGSAGLALAAYTLSSGPIWWAGFHSRYLIGLLIVTPALLWPLWQGARSISFPLAKLKNSNSFACQILLLLIVVVYLFGTINTFGKVSAAQVADQEQDGLIQNLIQIGATHIYTDYWTCDRIAFVSQERVICGVLGDFLEPNHNRYFPYYLIVKNDPHTAYVYPIDSGQGKMIVQKSGILNRGFRYFVFNGYFVYQPI